VASTGAACGSPGLPTAFQNTRGAALSGALPLRPIASPRLNPRRASLSHLPKHRTYTTANITRMVSLHINTPGTRPRTYDIGLETRLLIPCYTLRGKSYPTRVLKYLTHPLLLWVISQQPSFICNFERVLGLILRSK